MSDPLTALDAADALKTLAEALVEPMACRQPAYGVPDYAHCAACCYGTGYVVTCAEDEAILDAADAMRLAARVLSGESVDLARTPRAELRVSRTENQRLQAESEFLRVAQRGDTSALMDAFAERDELRTENQELREYVKWLVEQLDGVVWLSDLDEDRYDEICAKYEKAAGT